jgi:twitching motility protein PilT
MDLATTELDPFIRAAWSVRGSDVLLTPGSPPLMRVDGSLRRIDGQPVLDDDALDRYLDHVLTPVQRQEFHADLETDFAVSWAGVARIRGNAYHQRGGPAIALRLIPDRIPSFDELGLPASVRSVATLHQGLVLFTGPTGSGKSTSLAALIEWINDNRPCHIVTIEDPIEYVHEHRTAVVSQREVGADTHSFERALRSALREDPDVVLVGEMRDPESIAITLTLAETGHLVFSTLHTNDASQALDRIVDVFPAERQAQIRLQLASCLTAVVAQRLLPRIGGGMVAAWEVLMANHGVRNLIREGKTRQLRNAITMGQGDGMQTLEQSLNLLVASGFVTLDDALAKSLVPLEIERTYAPMTPNAGLPGA